MTKPESKYWRNQRRWPNLVAPALPLAAILLASLALGGCTGAMIGASAAGGVAIAQERTIGQAVDDKVIQAQINAELLQHSEGLFAKVDTKIVEGRVLLTGVVPSAEDRLAATELTWKVNGVTEVLNEIEVSDKSNLVDYAKDTWITTQLRAKMLSDREVSDINYSIETVNGAVFLFGISQTEDELKRVTSHARQIRGVTKVVSHVVGKSDRRRTQ